ncbi:KRF1 protein, partial [Todus mexicanus]|nr:KRF1 protein [Todus mexicanus]
MSPCQACGPCSPTLLANTCHEPCVRQRQDSITTVEPSFVVLTLIKPILSSFQQNIISESSFHTTVGRIL